MLFAVIKGPTLEEIKQQLKKAAVYQSSLELRFDLFQGVSLEEVKKALEGTLVPLLFTYRKKSELSLEEVLSLKPAYIDIALEEKDLLPKIHSCKRVLSYHNYEGMPSDLKELFSLMQQEEAELYKIAVTVTSTVSALKMLLFMKKHQRQLIGVAMGEKGQITRILAPYAGSMWTYGAVETKEHGQLLLSTLEEVYNFSSLSPNTKVYGLIGSPVTSSISEHTHNRFFREVKEDAVYVKMDLQKEEIKEFLSLALEVFSGLSVTMPLKEVFECGPVNTLVAKEKGWSFHNTDGKGALIALGRYLKIKGGKIAILGTGGTAKAIAKEGEKEGAKVYLYSRSKEKERTINGQRKPLQKADAIVNCTPIEDPDIRGIEAECFMEVKTKNLLTPFLQKGKKRVYGYTLFAEQAKLQFALFGIQGDHSLLDHIVQEHIYQLADGGIEHKIASGLPPERKPNFVPLS